MPTPMSPSTPNPANAVEAVGRNRGRDRERVLVGVDVFVVVGVDVGIEGDSVRVSLLICSPSCGPLLGVKRSSDGLRIRRKRGRKNSTPAMSRWRWRRRSGHAWERSHGMTGTWQVNYAGRRLR